MTIEENFAKWNQDLDQLERKVGLNIVHNPLAEYLSMTMEMVQKLTKVECGEIAYLISEYSLYLQKEYNRYNALANRLENTVKQMVINTFGQYTYASYDEKFHRAIADDTAASTMYKKLQDVQFKRDQLQNLSYSVNNMVQAIISIQKAKSGKIDG